MEKINIIKTKDKNFVATYKEIVAQDKTREGVINKVKRAKEIIYKN